MQATTQRRAAHAADGIHGDGPQAPVRTYLPGLDGLRALAVIAVIVYHLDPAWLPGGFLGVDVFFVVSGYLITSLLMEEWRKRSALSLRRFWARRARRLLPALAVLLFVVTMVAAVVAPDAVRRLRGDVPASIFFVMNWRLAIHHDSYVAALARPPLLLHLWSLAVEEQFYLLWPPVLLVLLRRRLSPSRIAALLLAGAVASAVAMGLVFSSHGDPSFVYFSTETHADGLLLGCAMGAVIPPWRMTSRVDRTGRRLLETSGVAALAIIVVGFAVLDFSSALTYRGGMFAVDAAACVVIVIAVHPACRLSRILDLSALRWCGLRSYALYLWHWPIFEATRPGIDVSVRGWSLVLLRLSLTAGAAEISYRLVEQPWRTGRAQAAIRARLRSGVHPRLWLMGVAAPVVAVAVVVATVSAPGVPPVLAEGSTPAARSAPPTVLANPGSDGPPAIDKTRHPSGLGPPVTEPVTKPVSKPTSAPSSTGGSLASHEPILAIGDSVLLAAGSSLSATFGSEITVDAAVSRQPDAGLDRLAAYRASGALSRYHSLVIDLGTNGRVDQAQFARLVQLSAGVPVVVIYTVYAQRPWISAANATIRSGVAGDPDQMRIADWSRVAGPGLLYPDGVHPDPAGAGVFSQLLVQALTSPKRG